MDIEWGVPCKHYCEEFGKCWQFGMDCDDVPEEVCNEFLNSEES